MSLFTDCQLMIQWKKKYISGKYLKSLWQIKFCTTPLQRNCSTNNHCMNFLKNLKNI